MAIRRSITCECGAPLWDEVIEGEKIVIEIAGVEINHVSGGCRQCGRRLEWHVTDQKLERIIKRRIRQMQNID